jgi:predicted ATPase
MLGEHPEDPLLLFSVLFSFWVRNYAAFDGKAMRELARQFLALADKSRSTALLMTASRLTGISLMTTGDIAGSLPRFTRTLELYDPAKHRSLATRFAIDAAVSALCFRSWSLWLLGYPDAALADAEEGLKNARELGQAATLMWALFYGFFPDIWCGKYAGARLRADELVVLANEKGTTFWKANGSRAQGYLLAEAGGAVDAIRMIRSGLDAYRSTGSTLRAPTDLSYLASAYLKVGEFEDAERCIREAMTAVESTDERWYEAEVNRITGEVALHSPDSETSESERYFEHALTIAREQQAKSWELRAATSLARLWRYQGKPRQARELLAPVYGWFTEGFDTRDLKEARVLLDTWGS